MVKAEAGESFSELYVVRRAAGVSAGKGGRAIGLPSLLVGLSCWDLLQTLLFQRHTPHKKYVHQSGWLSTK
jgi:hypothetical protein